MVWLFGCANVPAPIDSHFNKGVEHYDNQELAKAIEEYQLALRKNPNDTFSMYNPAVVYQDQGKTDQAENLSRYWSDLALKNDDPYVHRSVLDIYKILADQEIEELKTLEGQSSFARNL